jgi:hypothetical protein
MSTPVITRRRTRALRTLFVATAVLAVIAMLLLVTVTAVGNRQVLDQAVENGDRVRDCTTPGGECFEQAARRQAEVIGDPPAPINDVVILAAACADRPGVDTAAEIRTCVLDGLNEK